VLRCLLLAVLPLAAGCGAGIIGGVFASNRRSGAPGVRAATVDKPWMAYFGQEGESRLVTLTGYEAPATARLRVAVRLQGVVDHRGGAELPYLDWEQPNAQILEVRSNVTRILFQVNSTSLGETLLASGIDLTAADLGAQLLVQIDGADAAPPIPITVYRLMQATLELSRAGATEEVVSVAGGEFTCRLRGHPEGAEEFEIDVGTFDPAKRNGVLRQRISNVRVEAIAGSDELRLRATAPANTFSCRLFAAVRHGQAGLSTPIEPMYYGPDIGFVAPVTASADGGTRTLAVGAGLVPLTFVGTDTVATPDYDRIELWVEKGGRKSQVPPAVIQRRPASLSRLAFDLPAAPDGRPGPATLILRADLREGGVGAVVESRADGAFAYADAAPDFGPRGTRLPTRPQHVAYGRIEDTAGGFDAVACSGTLPTVHLFASSDNGMLRRFGAPWIAGASAELGERRPQRLLVSDLDGDGASDVLVLNGGDDITASHTALLGRAPPGPPLVVGGTVVRGAASTATMAYGDLDHNGMVDAVSLPPASSKLPPEVYLSFGTGNAVRMVTNQISEVIEGFEALELADFDGDGSLDLGLGRGGTSPLVATLYGRGDGTFVAGQTLLLEQIAGYTPSEDSRAVGVHAVGDGRLRGLAIVLAGRFSPETRATIAVLDYVGPRQHDFPRPVRVLAYDTSQAFVRSLATDLDDDGVRELLVASQETTTVAALHVFAWRDVLGEPGFVELDAVDLGAEPVLAITALSVGPAVAVPGASVERGVFVTHSFLISGEDRISTLLVDRSAGSLRLLAPDGTQQLPYTVDGLALGRFRGAATPPRALDVVVASSGSGGGALRGLQFMANDGVGVLRPTFTVDHTALPGTVATLPRAQGDAVLFLDTDRRLHVVQPTATNPRAVQSFGFDPYLPSALRQLALQPESRLAVGDVDGDGLDDVVALLVFPSGGAPTEPLAQLLLLEGRTGGSDELPFVVPDPLVVAAVSAHGSARDLVLGDFARGPQQLEVAVAVAGSVNHVRFYVLDRAGDPPQMHGLRRSYLSASEPFLIVGDGPERLAMADIDGDEADDLIVGTVADRQLRAFTNTAPSAGEVDVAAFRQLPIGLVTLPAGDLRHVVVRDLNGDGVADLVVGAVERFFGTSATVRYYLGTGTGQFANSVVIPSIRTGDQRWTSQGLVRREAPPAIAVGELNSDASVDLAIGWSTFGAGDRNFYELFGGAR